MAALDSHDVRISVPALALALAAGHTMATARHLDEPILTVNLKPREAIQDLLPWTLDLVEITE
ncbi:hypothetical protein AB0L44_38220 [Nonomuraea wenchangensis]|uniref:hypothetical protein n=1 Tax=Nonomuraea wenchangensis TaxID=568860 RepID=UPI0034251E6B